MATTNINRINEIQTQLTACSKETYRRDEVLPALKELQAQIVSLVFDETHAERGKLQIWDVRDHLSKMTETYGVSESGTLNSVLDGCNDLGNLIAAEISGGNGERKAFRALDHVHCHKRVLTNVEFTADDRRTELDAIVFTNKAVFIIEVKNSKKNILIDECGNYYRNRDLMIFDKNIGEKMNDKDLLLRQALEVSGWQNPNIISLVVFTNNQISVENQYQYIRTAFLSNLPHIIQCYEGPILYTDAEMDRMCSAVSSVACKEAYPLAMDVAQFKQNLAMALAELEDAAAGNNYIEEDEIPKAQIMANNLKEGPKNRKPFRNTLVATGAVAAIAGLAILVFQKVKRG